MAHGRIGPDLVLNIRYAGYSEIRSVSEHEKHREPDGSSDIDPARSSLNRILHGPATQQDAVDGFWKFGVKKPAKQAESPFVQMVLSVSPEYFRTNGRQAGEYDAERLTAWTEQSMEWLKSEYGDDLAHVSLHLDEQTPHLHVLVIPTYLKKPRTPGKPAKGESLESFEARKAAAAAAPGIRTAGRASSEKWASGLSRLHARKSYHAALEPLGIGYGKDFMAADEPAPEHKLTGAWVREEASRLKEDRAKLDAERVEFERERQQQERLILSKSSDLKKTEAGFVALSDEIKNETLWRDANGKINAKDPGTLVSGGPSVRAAAESVVDKIDGIRRERKENATLREKLEAALADAQSFVNKIKGILTKLTTEQRKEADQVVLEATELDRRMFAMLRKPSAPAPAPAQKENDDGPLGPSF